MRTGRAWRSWTGGWRCGRTVRDWTEARGCARTREDARGREDERRRERRGTRWIEDGGLGLGGRACRAEKQRNEDDAGFPLKGLRTESQTWASHPDPFTLSLIRSLSISRALPLDRWMWTDDNVELEAQLIALNGRLQGVRTLVAGMRQQLEAERNAVSALEVTADPSLRPRTQPPSQQPSPPSPSPVPLPQAQPPLPPVPTTQPPFPSPAPFLYTVTPLAQFAHWGGAGGMEPGRTPRLGADVCGGDPAGGPGLQPGRHGHHACRNGAGCQVRWPRAVASWRRGPHVP